ncbi:MAG: YggS family pyridoxal phosphate-dependent enzyme [Acidimicrobiaceae bacterium]|nr:YggS family pyridoxal phosphate-dependent enzyme [Acidimicrobiaceae bacterium]
MSVPPAASATLAGRYEALQARITGAGGQGVTVIAVTKALGAWAVDAAAACGIGDIGENYAQECVAKVAEAAAAPMPRVHFVGRLQRNKVRMLAGCVDVWQTVDRVELAREIGRRAPGADVMIQVNISHEETKAGCAPADTESLASATYDAGLSLVGLMGIGPLGPPEEARAGFRQLRRLVDSLGLRHCSMGMTDDLEVAVAEGATMVRVGRSLFGARPRQGLRGVAQYDAPPGDR